MTYTYDYTSVITGLSSEKEIKPIHKLEPEIIPEKNVFGIIDRNEADELIGVLKDNTINRINICFPLDSSDIPLIKKTFETIQHVLECGIRVSMSNIDTVDKIRLAQQTCGNTISYFSKAKMVPILEKYCRENNIPFLPVVSNENDISIRIAEGYRVVKAYPFVANQLFDILRTSYNEELLYNPAGGIIPVITDKDGTPQEINPFFLQCTELKNVLNISATDPAKCLLKLPHNRNPLERLNKYLEIISQK